MVAELKLVPDEIGRFRKARAKNPLLYILCRNKFALGIEPGLIGIFVRVGHKYFTSVQ